MTVKELEETINFSGQLLNSERFEKMLSIVFEEWEETNQ